MAKVVFLVGYPGSGKTYLATTKYVPLGFTLVDDPRTKEDRKKIAELVSQGVDIVVCDPHLTRKEVRDTATQLVTLAGATEIEYVYFEDNKEKAAINIKHRDDGRKILLHTYKYDLPENIEVIEIWNPQ